MSSAQVRPLHPSDVEAVIDLSLQAWEPVFASFEQQLGHALYARMYPDWREQQAESVRQAIAAHETWVSVDDEQVTGFVNVVFDVPQASAEIYMVAVDPAFQRRGIAGALTAHALDEMRSRGITLATVGTGGDPGHAPARRTYERAGFTAFPQVIYQRLLAPDGGG